MMANVKILQLYWLLSLDVSENWDPAATADVPLPLLLHHKHAHLQVIMMVMMLTMMMVIMMSVCSDLPITERLNTVNKIYYTRSANWQE